MWNPCFRVLSYYQHVSLVITYIYYRRNYFSANTDVDNSVEVTHEEVLQAAKEAGNRACNFVTRIIKEIQ